MRGIGRTEVDIDELLAILHGLLVDLGRDPDTLTAPLAVLAVVQVKVQVPAFDGASELLVGLAGGGNRHLVPFRRYLDGDDEAGGQQDTVGDFTLRCHSGRLERRGTARHEAAGRLRVIQEGRNGHRCVSSLVVRKGL